MDTDIALWRIQRLSRVVDKGFGGDGELQAGDLDMFLLFVSNYRKRIEALSDNDNKGLNDLFIEFLEAALNA